MAHNCSMDGVHEDFSGDDEMMGALRRPLPRASAAKSAIAAKTKAAVASAKVAKAAAKQVAKSSAPSRVKSEAASIASAAQSLAERAKRLSSMAGVEPMLMGDAGDFYNIGEDEMMGGPIDVVVKNWPLALAAAAVGVIIWKKSKK